MVIESSSLQPDLFTEGRSGCDGAREHEFGSGAGNAGVGATATGVSSLPVSKSGGRSRVPVDRRNVSLHEAGHAVPLSERGGLVKAYAGF